MHYHNLIIAAILMKTIKPLESFWLPAHELDLNEDETFEIAEDIFSDTNSLIGDEDEMIPQSEIKSLGLMQNSNKYYLLHQLTKRNSQKLKRTRQKIIISTEKQEIIVKKEEINEVNYDLDNFQPWIGGFEDKEGQIKSKNEILNQKNDIKYDYQDLKNKYRDEKETEEKIIKKFNVTEIKEDEHVKEAAKAMVEFKKTNNCTKEENRGIGYGALVCFLQDLKGPESQKVKTLLTRRITQILIISLMLYIVIAIPCWCQKGWCCCCFRCKFCKPVLCINDAKQFITMNPLGVYHTKDNMKIVYKPTYREEYVYKQLHKALMRA